MTVVVSVGNRCRGHIVDVGRGLAGSRSRCAGPLPRFGLLRYVWHPALFVFAVYLIVLSSMTLVAGR